jgi:hypothetical protein
VPAAAVFWVLCSEMFSMNVKAPASAAAMAVLFASGACANLVFLSLHSWLRSGAFLIFAAIAGDFHCRLLHDYGGLAMQYAWILFCSVFQSLIMP